MTALLHARGDGRGQAMRRGALSDRLCLGHAAGAGTTCRDIEFECAAPSGRFGLSRPCSAGPVLFACLEHRPTPFSPRRVRTLPSRAPRLAVHARRGLSINAVEGFGMPRSTGRQDLDSVRRISLRRTELAGHATQDCAETFGSFAPLIIGVRHAQQHEDVAWKNPGDRTTELFAENGR